MPPETEPSTTTLSRSVHLAASRALADRAPEVSFAARFLEQDRRRDLFAIASALILLHDVITGNAHRDERAGASTAAPESADAGSAAASGTCCGAGDSPLGRRTIARNIVDYLFNEAEIGLVGRPEFDAALWTIRRRTLSIEPFHRLIDATSDFYARKRFATRESLDRRLRLMADPLSSIVLAASGLAAASARGADSAGDGRATLWAAILRANAILRLRSLWAIDRQIAIPLDRVNQAGLTDRAIGDWLATPPDSAHRAVPHSSSRETSEKVQEIVRGECALAIAELERGSALIGSLLDDRAARSMTMYFSMLTSALQAVDAAPEELGRIPPARGRFTALRRAMLFRGGVPASALSGAERDA